MCRMEENGSGENFYSTVKDNYKSDFRGRVRDGI